MEIVRGKHASFMDAAALAECISGYATVHIDVGTGDGRFVRHMAQANAKTFVVGIDACRENLRDVSRGIGSNGLFMIANAHDLPSELYGVATHITINFPWGSLLEGLLANASSLMDGLSALASQRTTVEVRLNGGAVAEAGWSLEVGTERIWENLSACGWGMQSPQVMAVAELKRYPTTWAKRLAYGRDPRAMVLRGYRSFKREHT